MGMVTNKQLQQTMHLSLRMSPFHSWVQLIAGFVTKSAVPQRVLTGMVLEAIVEFHQQNATVVAVISNEASTNKSMRSIFGVTGNFRAPKHKIEHSCVPGRSLYFHLLHHKYSVANIFCYLALKLAYKFKKPALIFQSFSYFTDR